MNTPVVDFFDLPRTDLTTILGEEFDLSPYRSAQLYEWVYRKGVTDFAEMTNISKDIRIELAKRFQFNAPKVKDERLSIDGTKKFLVDVGDDKVVESVLIKQEKRKTLCVSSQVGCAMGCTFCQTGTMGLHSQLSTGDIIRQVQVASGGEFGGERAFDNIVFMGMGEPLHNYRAVSSAVRILTDDKGLGIGKRKITVSTVGLVPAIRKFFEDGLDVNLAVSLNATNDEVRSKIMPLNKRYPISELLGCLRESQGKGKKRLTIEYVMLGGVNDTPDDLKRLSKHMEGLNARLNLIPYNENTGLGFARPPKDRILKWCGELTGMGIVTTIRWSKGLDIDAACGQLVNTTTNSS